MAAPFVLGVCQRPAHSFLKFKSLLCILRPSNPCIGAFLVHTSCVSTGAVDNSGKKNSTSSWFRGPWRNKFERQHDIAGRRNCSVWRRNELLQADSMRSLRSPYWMVQTSHFKTKRSGGQSQDTSDLTTDEASSSRPPTPSGSGSGSGASVSDASAWMLRFSNDNAYASFCRNAYLSVIVAFTVILDETPVIFAREVSMLFLIIGFTQIVYGTATFMYSTIYLRQQTCMSRMTVFGICSMAVFHLLLWIMAITIFQSVGGDDDYDDLDDNGNSQARTFKKV